ncbi:hypothetical protein GN956_G22509 [Arapaima gigas]
MLARVPSWRNPEEKLQTPGPSVELTAEANSTGGRVLQKEREIPSHTGEDETRDVKLQKRCDLRLLKLLV